MRILACSIVIFSGALCHAFATIGTRNRDAQGWGTALILGGGILFLIEFFGESQEQLNASQHRPDDFER